MAIGALSTFGQSDFILSQMTKIQKQYQQVQAQVASGQTTDNFGDLGIQASMDVTLRNQLDMVSEYKKVVVQLQTRTSTMDQTMTTINTVTQNVQNIALASPQPDPTRGNIRSAAQNALQQIVQGLGASVDGRFLFSGTSTGTNPLLPVGTLQTNAQPFIDAAVQAAQTVPLPTAQQVQQIVANRLSQQPAAVQTALATAISNALAADTTPGTGLPQPGTNPTADAVQAAMSNFFSTSTNYYQGSNTFLPTSINLGVTVDYGIAANDPAFQSIFQGLVALADLPLPTTGNLSVTDYDKAAAAAAQTVSQGLIKLQGLIQKNGQNQQVLQTEGTNQDQTLTFLQKNVDNIESSNLPELSARLSVLQTQMQASFKVMAGLAQLSLVDFLR